MGTAFITGAGRRIGRGLAEKFAGAGWDIVVHYHTPGDEPVRFASELAERFQVRTCAVQADVRSAEEMRRACTEAAGILGPPTLLVNNAGVFPERRSLQATTEEYWDAVLDTNLRGQLTAAREFFAVCDPKKSRIINFGSLGGAEVWKQRIAYNVSKAGVFQLTKALARELAPDIPVNCIAPGLIDIPEDSVPMTVPPGAIPMERYGSIDDIFDAVYFFATCSTYITGQILFVDGGRQLV
jgi:NAD(P)-dependent dehydrogenase (short-subunit alcohol dehydrogenase family)